MNSSTTTTSTSAIAPPAARCLHSSPSSVSAALVINARCACACKSAGQSLSVTVQMITSKFGCVQGQSFPRKDTLWSAHSVKANGLQALVTLERARHMVAGAGALCMLGISAVLGRAAPLNSAGILGLTAGVTDPACACRGGVSIAVRYITAALLGVHAAMSIIRPCQR